MVVFKIMSLEQFIRYQQARRCFFIFYSSELERFETQMYLHLFYAMGYTHAE